MIRHKWKFDGDIETFFTNLRSAVDFYDYKPYNKRLGLNLFKKNCFVMFENSNNRFILYYHSAFRKKMPFVVLLGKVKQTPTGVTVTGTLRAFLFFCICLAFWFSALLFGIYNTLFIEPWLSASAFPLSIVLLFSILVVIIEWIRSNTKGIIELMDNLQYTVLPEPEPEQKEKRAPRKTLTREEMFYRTPNKYTVPTKMYTTPNKPPKINKSNKEENKPSK